MMVNDDCDFDSETQGLILHMDINSTILAFDPASGVSLEETLNIYLAGATWGRTETDGSWTWLSDKVTKHSPIPRHERGETYYVYQARRIGLPGGYPTRHDFKKAMGQFTRSEDGAPFRDILNLLLKSLQWQEQITPDESSYLYQTWDTDTLGTSRFHYLFPSFFRLLKSLEQTKHLVVFRTYGTDLPEVALALKAFTRQEHPRWPDVLNDFRMKLHGTIRRSVSGMEFELARGSAKRTKQRVPFRKFSNESEFVAWLDKQVQKSRVNVIGIQDDYEHWRDWNYRRRSGKPIWRPFQSNNHHVFLDDNIRADTSNSIGDLRVEQADGSYRSMCANSVTVDHVHLLAVDLKEAITDEWYYVKLIKQSLEANKKLHEHYNFIDLCRLPSDSSGSCVQMETRVDPGG